MDKKSQAIDHFWQLLWGFASQRVITVAGRTGILSHLASQSATVPEIAKKLALDPLATGKMVRALKALAILETDGKAYSITPELAPYFKMNDDNIQAFLEHSHVLYDRWGENLEAWVRGEAWESKKQHPDGGALQFGKAMGALGSIVAERAVEGIDLEGSRKLLDLGGGLGHYSKAFLKAEKQLCATVLDIPEVADLGKQKIQGTQWEGRLEFVGQDYLEAECSSDYDIVLLANILHQEPKERAQRLIEKGAKALGPGGRVVVIDFAIDREQQNSVMGALFAINMRSFGDTYPAATIRSWMHRAGIGDVQRSDLGPNLWMIIGRKPA